ncbi:hypothetical protein FJZ28_01410 [Candidatus Peregrinibacteria bacterium]|nr:hypothetical protein [Candidatus Peregrinibacteria bacterium]
MSYQQNEPIGRKLTIVVGLTVVGVMAFGFALSFYRNVLFEKTLEDISEGNQSLRKRIEEGYRELEYHKSAQYKDKYAKENLGLVHPDESVLIITQLKRDTMMEDIRIKPTEQQEAAYEELLRQMPVTEHWRLFFFHSDRIEDIKKGL